MNIEKAVLESIKDGCVVFYTGAMGEFDSIFSAAVRRAKKVYPNIKLICVKPYMTRDINRDKGYYTAMYDDIIVPDELAGIHFKAAIKARNRWVIDHSDMLIVYLIRDHGGAFEAKRYAEHMSKYIIIIH